MASETPPISRFDLRFKDHLEPEKKKFYNERLFTTVAPRYDFITRALSLGRDGEWKRRLVRALPDFDAPFCVDLACGTGDVSRMLAQRYPHGKVLGLDLTWRMLEIAACRGGTPNLHFKQGDMSATGLETGCAHVVTGSYALRNAPELGQTLAEIHRVLCPGGVAAFLEFSKPPERIAQFCEYWLLKVWGSFWGLVLHGNMEVYAYIAESLRTFPDRLQLRKAFTDRGFEVLQTGRLYFGVLEILVARKRNSDWAS